MSNSILVVEDTDDKFNAVASVTANFFASEIDIRRAATIVDAEQLTAENRWQLLILDISMDIVASLSGRAQNGHASTGGMAVLERMYLLGREVPTIIVTAFDAFRAAGSQREDEGILGIEDISRKAKQLLGDKFLGAVRYGSDGWEDGLRKLLARVAIR